MAISISSYKSYWATKPNSLFHRQGDYMQSVVNLLRIDHRDKYFLYFVFTFKFSPTLMSCWLCTSYLWGVILGLKKVEWFNNHRISHFLFYWVVEFPSILIIGILSILISPLMPQPRPKKWGLLEYGYLLLSSIKKKEIVECDING